MPMPSPARRGPGICAILVLTALASAVLTGAGALAWLDRMTLAARQAAAPRPATGAFVFVAIDKASLDEVGVWPWPRRMHGEIIDRLAEAGVSEIYLDIDFSAHAPDPAEDAALAAALDRAGGRVTLAAFLQRAAVDDAALAASLPVDLLRERAWIGTVNVRPGPDGRIRDFGYGERLGGEEVPSMPALMSGRLGPAGTAFAIDYGIRAETVPMLSAAAVLRGAFDPAQVAGRIAVLGASAVELRDIFMTPVQGALPGALIQILAAETLAQDRTRPRPGPFGPLALVAAIFAACCGSGLAGAFRARLGLGIGLGIGIEALGFAAYAAQGLDLPTAPATAFLAGALVLMALAELDLRKWLFRRARAEADNAMRVIEQVFLDSAEAILVLAPGGAVLRQSRTAEALFDLGGLDPAAAGACLPEAIRAAVRAALAEGGSARAFEIDTPDAAGAPRLLDCVVTPSRLVAPDGTGQEGAVATVLARDVTEVRRHAQRLDELARFDELTGAARRGEFLAQLEAALDASGPARGPLAVFVLGLRRLSAINATLGRSVGDAVAVAAAQRLAALGLGPVGRIDGGTFALYAEAGDAAASAARLSAELHRPYAVGGASVQIGAQIGYAVIGPKDAATAAQAMARAECALDAARGAAAVALFDPATAERVARAQRIEAALWTAIERGEIFVVYQPQVDLRDGRLLGAEALVRWRHPELGLVSPVEMIPIAEANGFIDRLGRHVLETACREARGWPEDLTVAVNLSPAQFRRTDVPAMVAAALREARLPAARLQLEITESLFIDGAHGAQEAIQDVRLSGVGIALDDFGAGYSSLGYVQRFPIDKIKVDRAFVTHVAEQRGSRAVLRAVASLAGDLGAVMLCEGIETERQAEILRGLGCEQAQGYLFGRPMEAGAFGALAAATARRAEAR